MAHGQCANSIWLDWAQKIDNYCFSFASAAALVALATPSTKRRAHRLAVKHLQQAKGIVWRFREVPGCRKTQTPIRIR